MVSCSTSIHPAIQEDLEHPEDGKLCLGPDQAHVYSQDSGLGQIESFYDQQAWNLQNDEHWLSDITLGRRIGFYELKGDIGRGNFSSVRLAKHSITDERVAIKLIDKTKLDGKMTKMLLREITVMDACHHPHLVRLYEVVENNSKIHLTMQLAPGGELFTKLTEHGKFSEPRAKKIFVQISSAVSYMHECNMIHRDLKAENVFFTSRDQVVVGDFGFATRLDKVEQHLTTFCGSPPYAAPELFQDDHYIGPPVDIWALGIILYFLVTGTMPFRAGTVASLKHAILEGSFITPSYLSETCTKLITNLLKRKPSIRYTMKQIASCGWLDGSEWVEEDGGYRPYPRLGSPNLSDTEKAVQEQLTTLGITEEMLRKDINQGVRSPVIATYRILLHKQILTPNIESTHSLKSGKRLSSKKLTNTIVNPTLDSGKAQKEKSPKSRTCVVL